MRAVVLVALALAGCGGGGGAGDGAATGAKTGAAATVVPVTITGPGGRHVFRAELARTAAEQERCLMYRTDLKPDGGMLFAPYPAGGGAPKIATFWMKNTPTPLDIIYIRSDGTIAHIAENTLPFSEAMVSSGEPVAAVLEVVGGRTAEVGVSEGDKVSWDKR